MQLVFVLFARMLCPPPVPGARSACMQLWCNPALTPAPYSILNPQEDAMVDPGQSGPKPAVMVGMGSFSATVYLEPLSRFQGYWLSSLSLVSLSVWFQSGEQPNSMQVTGGVARGRGAEEL